MTTKFNPGDIVALNSIPYRECRVIEIDTNDPKRHRYLIRYYDPHKDRLITDWFTENSLQSHNSEKLSHLFE